MRLATTRADSVKATDQANGHCNTKRKVFYGKTQQEVKASLLQARHELANGLPVQVGRQQTLAQFLDSWLTDVVKPSTRPLTYESYSRIVRLHLTPTLGRLALDQVTP